MARPCLPSPLLSYFGKIDDNRKLYCAGAISCALYLALSLLNLGDADHSSGIRRLLTWSLNVLCWMEIFTNYKPRFALFIMIALAYAVNVAVKPLLQGHGACRSKAHSPHSWQFQLSYSGICIRYDKAIAYDTLANEQAFSDTSCHENDHALGSVFSRTLGPLPALLLFHLSADSLSKPTCFPQHGIRAKQRNGAHLPRRSDSYGLRIARFFDSKSEYRLHVPHSRRLDCNDVVHAIYGIARSFGIGQYHDGYFDFVLRIALAHARERSPRKGSSRIFSPASALPWESHVCRLWRGSGNAPTGPSAAISSFRAQ